MTAMRTSEEGMEFLILHEGEVLKAYRDVVGVWTIGVGLTKASGVVTPKAGMTITKSESRRLLDQALKWNYEPAVRAKMGQKSQNAFDGAVSFHWNTGEIGRASWVPHFLKGALGEAERRFKQWNKAGGRVFRGLVRRRDEEWKLIRYGIYTGVDTTGRHIGGFAKIVISHDAADVREWKEWLHTLGYTVELDGVIGVPEDAVRAFQRDHDLTVDGVIGTATQSTMQRQIDARRKLGQTAAAGGAGGAAEAAPADIPLPDGAGLIVLVGAAIFALWLLWRYRDWVAARIQKAFPRFAAWLRAR